MDKDAEAEAKESFASEGDENVVTEAGDGDNAEMDANADDGPPTLTFRDCKTKHAVIVVSGQPRGMAHRRGSAVVRAAPPHNNHLHATPPTATQYIVQTHGKHAHKTHKTDGSPASHTDPQAMARDDGNELLRGGQRGMISKLDKEDGMVRSRRVEWRSARRFAMRHAKLADDCRLSSALSNAAVPNAAVRPPPRGNRSWCRSRTAGRSGSNRAH